MSLGERLDILVANARISLALPIAETTVDACARRIFWCSSCCPSLVKATASPSCRQTCAYYE
jgi:hypothetical protein